MPPEQLPRCWQTKQFPARITLQQSKGLIGQNWLVKLFCAALDELGTREQQTVRTVRTRHANVLLFMKPPW
jgi:hypothetical protein